MAKAAVTRRIRDDHQKNFLKIFNSLTGKHSRWEIWEDFVTLTAIEISNSTDKVNAPERTKMYQTIVSKYSAKERDGMVEMLAEVIMGMEQNPDQDFLGSLYMMCELGNDHAGQFFTPYDVCRCMAEITFDPKLHPDMEGFISVSDPACGAGATLLAFLNVCKRRNICYHNKVLVIAQDIDFIVGLMCYIQCSFMGCAGYVVIGDTLVNPATAYDSRGLLPAGPQNRIWYMNNRVCCLYRVSTDKQVDFNSNHEADLPMQRKACHKFAEAKGWVIVHEEQEEGVSGHKVRAEARDKLQIIKDYARKGKFDILLVFMFDRIGRIADETPFVVEWFVRNGIRVWSTQEGEQRFDNHTDKLLNYIRFWQADGESEKTSVRTRTSLRQLVEEGHFKGGSAPYGYDLVKSGRINKRKHELYELHINEREAAVVRIIFDKYVHEGYGPQHIATYLNDNGYRARSGKCWHPASIRGMVRNLTYTGVLRCGDAHSELLQELQIIPAQQFEAAQRIRENRSNRAAQESEYRVPLNIHGQSLLSGNAYCGHCGAKLTLTSSRKWRKLSDGTLDDTLRVRYTCYGKLRKQTGCTGQTGYTVHILDEIIDKSVRQIFSKMRGIPKGQIITRRYEREVVERKNHLQTIQVERDKAQKDLISLKAEILACIKGESVFPKETLAEMITAQEEKLRELDALYESSYAETEKTAELMDNVSKLYEELISFSDLYDSASFEAKKMIVNQLIRRVDVYRGYQLNITFNFDLTPYIEGDDAAAC